MAPPSDSRPSDSRPPDADIAPAVRNALTRVDYNDDEHPPRYALLGLDRSANLLELVVIVADGNRHVIIHAMRARPRWPARSVWRGHMKPYTHNGRIVTDEEIQPLADEAEAGYDVSKLRRRPGRPSLGTAAADVFPVRLDPELRAALEARAQRDDMTASDVVRTALRAYLSVA